ncbi:hypothetical protein AAFF_G00231090 [Aldrovandia affinis]|uniref:Uncharacterized protein n=1 Tax=Aldrovandia affinis TaxID=143900 RepID=A0AAD7RF36_9TELE|nr:hypothetical protein AAFF_G00231090 [Aldrovandia affinis]
MARDISSIYALLKETSEEQESKLNAIQSAMRAVEAKLTDIGARLGNAMSRIDFLEDANRAWRLTLQPHKVRQRIAEAAPKIGKVSWDGHHIMVFPDYSKLVSEKRAAFNQCKRLLHKRRVKFSLMYPVVLTLKVEGRREFTDPKKALTYIRSLPP